MGLHLFLLGLPCLQLLNRGADIGFPEEGLVLSRVIRRQHGHGDVHLLEQFGGLGEFVAVHIWLTIGPGPAVGGQSVVLGFGAVADAKPKHGEVTMRRLAQLGETLGFSARSVASELP